MVEQSYIDLLRKFLKGELTLGEVKPIVEVRLRNEPSKVSKSKNSCIKRLLRAYENIQRQEESWEDFAINLRHCILNYNQKLEISKMIHHNIIKTKVDFGFSYMDYGDFIEVDVIEVYPNWLDENDTLKKLYSFEEEKKEFVLGDPSLYNMTGYEHYNSPSQKIIIRASMNQPEGSTLLACLPTGGGKSLIGQMPAYYEKKGLTIVIVPTVALAIDQAQNATKYFKTSRKPKAYHSGVSYEVRNQIFNEIKTGQLPLLYISPESILNSKFNEVIFEASKSGLVNRLVIDEAHIVIDWGDYFRTEFQFLSVFRRKIIKASQGKLKTLLLSATLSDRTTDILKFMFSEENNIIEIRGDHLRYEIMYYLTRSNNDYERKQKALDLISYLPRPIIIYVDKPETAERLKEKVKDKGFYSTETFTGKTPDDVREKLITLWNDDKIDIMIATSAFGMGVDKQDIRGVIHCYIPENINRLYQEVGRAGRDGFPCFSILNVTTNEDYSYINFLTSSKVATVETIVTRWSDILDNYVNRESGDEFWIDTDVTPSYLKGEKTGQQSATWNEYVILFLYRKGLIDILDVKLEEKSKRYHILIKMILLDILTDREKLTEYLTPIREEERNAIDKDIIQIKNLAKDYHDECWSNFFTDIYSFSNNLCRGCPSCRGRKRGPYNSKQFIFIEEGKDKLQNLSVNDNERLLQNYSSGRELIWEFNIEEISLNDTMIFESLNSLCENGINNLVIPNLDPQSWSEVLKKLQLIMDQYVSIFTYEEALNSDFNPLLSGITAVVYSNDIEWNNELFLKLRMRLLNNLNSRIVHVVPKDLIISCENRKLRDCLDAPLKTIVL